VLFIPVLWRVHDDLYPYWLLQKWCQVYLRFPLSSSAPSIFVLLSIVNRRPLIKPSGVYSYIFLSSLFNTNIWKENKKCLKLVLSLLLEVSPLFFIFTHDDVFGVWNIATISIHDSLFISISYSTRCFHHILNGNIITLISHHAAYPCIMSFCWSKCLLLLL